MGVLGLGAGVWLRRLHRGVLGLRAGIWLRWLHRCIVSLVGAVLLRRLYWGVLRPVAAILLVKRPRLLRSGFLLVAHGLVLLLDIGVGLALS
jgi:hypothetical protein